MLHAPAACLRPAERPLCLLPGAIIFIAEDTGYCIARVTEIARKDSGSSSQHTELRVLPVSQLHASWRLVDPELRVRIALLPTEDDARGQARAILPRCRG